MIGNRTLTSAILCFFLLLGTASTLAQEATEITVAIPEATTTEEVRETIVASDVFFPYEDALSTADPFPPTEQEKMLGSIQTMLAKAKEDNSRRSVMYTAGLTEEECLATAMYHEARGEGELGMKAVAYVIHNRTQNSKWPGTYCGVILQRNQFSFTNDRNPDNIKQWSIYEVALRMATNLIHGGFVTQSSPVKNATYFHSLARTARNAYAFRRPLIIKIGHHNFFK